MADFLLEIGLDEIPARMIAQAEAELGRRVHDLLTRERLLAADAKVTTYSTPRRLAVVAEGVLAGQADTEEQMTGPSWKVAFKDDAPTAAAEAFAKKAGCEVSALTKVTNAKGEYVGATVKRQGLATPQVLTAEIAKEVLSLYWAKNMYWRAGKPERFVRPVRWVVALLDQAIVPVEIAGITASNVSRGHRILHGTAPVVLASPKSYAETLRAAKVVVDVAERRQTIRKALDAATRTVAGARWREDEALLETVVHLTEWPTVILGNFEAEYLKLPEEVLVTVMRDHQKYFAVEAADGKLAPHFLAVLNIEVDKEGYATIQHGNQKVLRARFKDARFFWDFDQKISLADRVESLKNVTFQKQLGSYHWKTEQNLAIAARLSGNLKIKGIQFDEAALTEAVKLAKTDLTTELVKEFTELQGIIGGVYAEAQGLGATVGRAIYTQYMPASIEDDIPDTPEGQILGLSDRIQTIMAMFGIGLAPTGSKDPFALRRAANAIIKILAESKLPLDVSDVVDVSVSAGANGLPDDKTANAVRAFLNERVQFYLRDVCGLAYDVVNAVLASLDERIRECGSYNIPDLIAYAEAITEIRGSEDFKNICETFKRIKNIVKQAHEKGFAFAADASGNDSAEAKALTQAAAAIAPKVAALRDARNYSEALALIATLRPTVDAFFDKVMVLDPDEKKRGANLALIAGILESFSTIADFSEIVTS